MIEQAPKHSGQLVRFARSHQSRGIIGSPCLPEAYPAVLGGRIQLPGRPGGRVHRLRLAIRVAMRLVSRASYRRSRSSGNAYMSALMEHGNVRVGFPGNRQVEEAVDQLCAAVGLLVQNVRYHLSLAR